MGYIKRVCVGVSGGVDSAVAALLLKRKGFDVHGVFMRNWDEADETGVCSAKKDLEDAKAVCDRIGVPLAEVDFVKRYWNEVFSPLIKEYRCGYTPNPDILCNRSVKFDSFYKHCRERLGADAIATGHYADTSFGPFLERFSPDARVRLMLPADKIKDQTFFLSQVKQEPLQRTMFPLATYRKTTVREIANQNGLQNVGKKRDSVGICFIGNRNFQEFISEYVPSQPGDFIDIDTGKIVGSHNGIHQWTIGQRCNIGGLPTALFVVKKDLQKNNIYVAAGTHHPSLKVNILMTNHPHWICEEPEVLRENGVLECYFRYQHVVKLVKCRITKSTNGLLVMLDEAQRAIACGQYAVFFSDSECYGSGQITHLGPSQYFTD